MTKYKNLTIEVTQEHIDEGVPNDCDDCAISLAFRDALVKVYGNKCLIWTKTSMSNGEVELQYSVEDVTTDANFAGESVFEAVNLDNNCFSIGEYKSEDLQYKIDAFVNEYDNNFLTSDGHTTMPLDDFTPRHCVPFTFDVGLPA